MPHRRSRAPIVAVAALVTASLAAAPAPAAAQGPARFDTTLFRALEWREVGPFRGGRVTAVAGVPDQPLVYYMGATGGGVWKTTDGGLTWRPMADRFLTAGSIGAIAVAPSDPNVVYVGTGESPIRGNVSPGDGMYRSTDGGNTWTKIGLADAGQIAHIVVHPHDPDLVYVAVLGHAFGPNPTRGVFRSRDGGRTWQTILFRSDSAGACDLAMDPTNPRILYAGFWQAVRRPWELVLEVHRRGRHLAGAHAQPRPAARHHRQGGPRRLAAQAGAGVGAGRGGFGRPVPLRRRGSHLDAHERRSRHPPARLVFHARGRRPGQRGRRLCA
jgi:hypothetical protein